MLFLSMHKNLMVVRTTFCIVELSGKNDAPYLKEKKKKNPLNTLVFSFKDPLAKAKRDSDRLLTKIKLSIY